MKPWFVEMYILCLVVIHDWKLGQFLITYSSYVVHVLINTTDHAQYVWMHIVFL